MSSATVEMIEASAHDPVDVLVVEELQINRMIVESQRQLRGCRVVQAKNATQALVKAKEPSSTSHWSTSTCRT